MAVFNNQVVPFPKPWEKRHAAEGWDTFRLVISPGAEPPPPAGEGLFVIPQIIPFPRDDTHQIILRQKDGWKDFRPFYQPPVGMPISSGSLRFWPDDEAFRLTGWDYFRPYWTEPGAPPPPPVAGFQAYVTPPSLLIETKDEAKRIDHWKEFRPFWAQPPSFQVLMPPPPPPPPWPEMEFQRADTWAQFRPYWVAPPIPPPPPPSGGGEYPPWPAWPPFPDFPPFPPFPPLPEGVGGGGGLIRGSVYIDERTRDERQEEDVLDKAFEEIKIEKQVTLGTGTLSEDADKKLAKVETDEGRKKTLDERLKEIDDKVKNLEDTILLFKSL